MNASKSKALMRRGFSLCENLGFCVPKTRRFSGQGVIPVVAAVSMLVAGIVFGGGCQIPLPQATADPTRYFVLSATSAAAIPAEAGAPAVRLREVELAGYLRTQPIVVRRGNNEIEFREYARWGEALEQGIGRVLREELVAQGVAGAVLAPGLRSPALAHERELKVRVLAAEGGAGGTVNFRAVWELHTGGAKPELVGRGDFRAASLTWDGTNEGTLVAKLSEAVAGLAAEISAALRK